MSELTPPTSANDLNPDLKRSVLLGLSRAPLAPHALGLASVTDPELTSALNSQPPEVAIWQVLVTQALMSRAGYLAASVNVRLAPALPAVRRPCPLKVEQIFALLQKDIHGELLDEWLYLLHTQGYRMPHAQLPALFELGKKRPHLRQDIVTVADQRGAWLLAQHATWGDFYLDEEADPAKDWSTGQIKKRSEAFRIMRKRDPVAALHALQQDWAQESVESRTALLSRLTPELSMADEPFLESVLDDPRKDIRQIAQRLLRRLPASRLVQRCSAHAANLLRLEKKLFRAATLHVTLPESGDASLLRDGIYPERYKSLGDKASILLYLIASVPPEEWLTRWQLTAAELIALITGHEHEAALYTGLLQATARQLQRNGAASSALIQLYQLLLHGLAQDANLLELNPRMTDGFSSLLPAQQSQILQQWLIIPARDSNQARTILSLCSSAITACRYAEIYQWPAILSAQAAAQIRTVMHANGHSPWGLESILNPLARIILSAADVEALCRTLDRVPLGQREPWERTLDGLRELISFRQSLQQAFQQ